MHLFFTVHSLTPLICSKIREKAMCPSLWLLSAFLIPSYSPTPITIAIVQANFVTGTAYLRKFPGRMSGVSPLERKTYNHRNPGEEKLQLQNPDKIAKVRPKQHHYPWAGDKQPFPFERSEKRVFCYTTAIDPFSKIWWSKQKAQGGGCNQGWKKGVGVFFHRGGETENTCWGGQVWEEGHSRLPMSAVQFSEAWTKKWFYCWPMTT